MVLSSGAEGREIKNNPTSPHNLMPHLICLLLSSPHSTYKNIFLFHIFKNYSAYSTDRLHSKTLLSLSLAHRII